MIKQYFIWVVVFIFSLFAVGCSTDNESNDLLENNDEPVAEDVSTPIEVPDDPNAVRIWTPSPNLLIGDQMITVEWPTSFAYPQFEAVETRICCLEPLATPDYFEVYQSDNLHGNYIKVGTINEWHSGLAVCHISHLTNQKVYYFYVKALKDGFSSTISDTIMSVPNRLPSQNVLFSKDAEFVQAVISPGKDRVAYVDHYYTWYDQFERMASTIFISDMNGKNPEKIEINSYSPDWSPDGKTIVFHTDKGEINTGNGMASQIAVYDCQSKTIKKLTNDHYSKYEPVFSKTGDKILCMLIDDEQRENYYLLIDSKTGASRTILDWKANNLTYWGYSERGAWIDDDRFLFHAKNENYIYGIYEYSVDTEQLKLVMDTPYNDCSPLISPDEKYLLFISDRSGYEQLWLYNFNSEKLKQLTSFSYKDTNYISNANRLGWIDNNTVYFNPNRNKVVTIQID
ncbi:MAG: hypothetical protein LBV74_01840 [Tannerella sp.]|jgi:hypothetical protein|nr:hypothetical protein [Tannerella sp.]